MILTRGTKCTAVIKSDPPLPRRFPFFYLSLLPSINCRSILAHFDRENSEVVIPFRGFDVLFPSFFLPDRITLISLFFPFVITLPYVFFFGLF